MLKNFILSAHSYMKLNTFTFLAYCIIINHIFIDWLQAHPGDLRGPTPFEDMIFYLWTDSNEICTAYVKLNSKHILFMRIF